MVKPGRKLEESIDSKRMLVKHPRKLAPLSNPPLPTTNQQFSVEIKVVKSVKPQINDDLKRILFDLKGENGFNFDFLDHFQPEKRSNPKEHIDSLIKELDVSSRHGL